MTKSFDHCVCDWEVFRFYDDCILFCIHREAFQHGSGQAEPLVLGFAADRVWVF